MMDALVIAYHVAELILGLVGLGAGLMAVILFVAEEAEIGGWDGRICSAANDIK